jgi:SSS family solute:Na+ symporter
MEHQLPQLPFAQDALAPFISKETIEYHYGKHHQAYVTNLNALIKGTEYENLGLEDIIKKAYNKPIEGKHQMIVSRLTVLFVSVLAFLLALTATSIVQVITTALAITTSFTILILANIYFPKICKYAAGFPMMIASLALWIVWTFAPQIRGMWGGQLIYPEWILCLAIFIICAIFGKKPAGRLVPVKEE